MAWSPCFSLRKPIWDLLPPNPGDHQTLFIFGHVGFHVTLSFIYYMLAHGHFYFWWACVKWSGSATHFQWSFVTSVHILSVRCLKCNPTNDWRWPCSNLQWSCLGFMALNPCTPFMIFNVMYTICKGPKLDA